MISNDGRNVTIRLREADLDSVGLGFNKALFSLLSEKTSQTYVSGLIVKQPLIKFEGYNCSRIEKIIDDNYDEAYIIIYLYKI